MEEGNEKAEIISTLTISFNSQTGDTTVTGPLDNKIFCMGLLESAKDVIRDFNAKRRSNSNDNY